MRRRCRAPAWLRQAGGTEGSRMSEMRDDPRPPSRGGGAALGQGRVEVVADAGHGGAHACFCSCVGITASGDETGERVHDAFEDALRMEAGELIGSVELLENRTRA